MTNYQELVNDTDKLLGWAVSQPDIIRELLADGGVLTILIEIANNSWIDHCQEQVTEEENTEFANFGTVTREVNGHTLVYQSIVDEVFDYESNQHIRPVYHWKGDDIDFEFDDKETVIGVHWYENPYKGKNKPFVLLEIDDFRAPDDSLHMFTAFREATENELQQIKEWL